MISTTVRAYLSSFPPLPPLQASPFLSPPSSLLPCLARVLSYQRLAAFDDLSSVAVGKQERIARNRDRPQILEPAKDRIAQIRDLPHATTATTMRVYS